MTNSLWCQTGEELLTRIRHQRDDKAQLLDTLTDITAYENSHTLEGPKRFVVVYHFFSTKLFSRQRLKLACNEQEKLPTLSFLFPNANWLEREIFDMYGLSFQDHPDLRRILMDERFVGYPLRKDYDIEKRHPFPDSIKINMDRGTEKHEDPKKEEKKVPLSDFYNPNILVNLGPSHPAMHGTLRIMCRLNGEVVEEAKCELGLLHRAIEKLGETKTYHQWIVYTDRLNYCSALSNNIGYVMAVENLMGITITERCMWLRMICMELSRIIDHIVCVAINALDMGAMTVFWLLYHWREEAYTMIESLCGMRLTTSYARIGGMMHDIPDTFEKRLEKYCQDFPYALEEVSDLLTYNRIWIDRTYHVGTLTKEDAIAYSATGPIARASGLNIDLRRDNPYYGYKELNFDIPIGSNGDVYDRYLVRMEEMRQSIRILKQSLSFLKKANGPLWVSDKRVFIPEKQDVYTKMEVLIHHFKIFMEGIDVPPGEIYSATEAPNGELGFYIVSRGGPMAHRMRIRSPSFAHYQLMEHLLKGEKIPDAISILGSLNIIAGELDR